MSGTKTGLLYMIISIVYTVVNWLRAKFSKQEKIAKDADTTFQEGMKESDEAKITAALDQLNRVKK